MADLVNVKGLSDLQGLLDKLPAKIEQNILRGALRQGANVIKAEAQSQLASAGHNKTGQLSKGLKVATRSKGGVVTATVSAKGKHGYVARWIEYGTAAHTIAAKNGKELFFAGSFVKSVRHPGIINPKPFFRPAMDGKAGDAVIAVGEAIKKRLTKEGIDASDVDVG